MGQTEAALAVEAFGGEVCNLRGGQALDAEPEVGLRLEPVGRGGLGGVVRMVEGDDVCTTGSQTSRQCGGEGAAAAEVAQGDPPFVEVGPAAQK